MFVITVRRQINNKTVSYWLENVAGAYRLPSIASAHKYLKKTLPHYVEQRSELEYSGVVAGIHELYIDTYTIRSEHAPDIRALIKEESRNRLKGRYNLGGILC